LNRWFLGLILVISVPLQGLASDFLSLNGIKPDLGFTAVYFSGLFLGSGRGMWAGFLVGLFADSLSGTTGLVQSASLMVIGWIAGEIRKNLLNLRLFFNSLIIFLLSVLNSVIIHVIWNLHPEGNPAAYSWTGIIFPKGAYDAMVGLLIFWILFKKYKTFSGDLKGFERSSLFTAG